MTRIEPQSNRPLELYIDGINFYPSILRDLSSAKRFVYIENYLIEPGSLWERFKEVLHDLSNKGIIVKGVFDAFGSRRIAGDVLSLNQRANIDIHLFHPLKMSKLTGNLYRTHIKLFIIDGEVAYTGGAGITNHFYNPESKRSNWSDVMIRVSDDSVKKIAQLYAWKFRSLTRKSLSLANPLYRPFNETNRELTGWLYAHHLTTHWIKKAVYKKLSVAKQKIWINSAYFYPTKKMVRYLTRKSLAGVDVRLLLPGITDVLFMKYLARGRYKKLLEAGVSIYEIKDRFLHSKIIVVDNWVTLGSFNIDILSLRFNQELNYATTDADFLASIDEFFNTKFDKSEPIDLNRWSRRAFFLKIFERLSYQLVRIFQKFLR